MEPGCHWIRSRTWSSTEHEDTSSSGIRPPGPERDGHNAGVDASVAGLLGAGIGAVGTALTAGVTGLVARSQMKLQIEGQRRQTELQLRAEVAGHRRSPQREGYGQVLRVVAALGSQLDEQCAVIENGGADWYASLTSLPPLERSQLEEAVVAINLDAPLDMQAAGLRLVGTFAKAQQALHLWIAARLQATAHEGPDTRLVLAQRREAMDHAREIMRTVVLDYTVLASDVIWGLDTESDEDSRARRKRLADRMFKSDRPSGTAG